MNQRLATIFLNLSSLHSSPARFNIRFFMNATKRKVFCYTMNAFPKAETPADSTMALVFTAQSLRNASRGVKKEKCSEVMHRSYSGVLIRAAASRNVPLHAASPMSGVQKRDFHFASLKAKYQNFVTRNSIYIAEINNTALKYGLFGVAVGSTLHAL